MKFKAIIYLRKPIELTDGSSVNVIEANEINAKVILRAFSDAYGSVDFILNSPESTEDLKEALEMAKIEIYTIKPDGTEVKLFDGFLGSVFITPVKGETTNIIKGTLIGWQRILKNVKLSLPRYAGVGSDMSLISKIADVPYDDIATSLCMAKCNLPGIFVLDFSLSQILLNLTALITGTFDPNSDLFSPPILTIPITDDEGNVIDTINVTRESIVEFIRCVPKGDCVTGTITSYYDCVSVDPSVGGHLCCLQKYISWMHSYFLYPDIGTDLLPETEEITFDIYGGLCANEAGVSVGNYSLCNAQGCYPPSTIPDDQKHLYVGCFVPDISPIGGVCEPDRARIVNMLNDLTGANACKGFVYWGGHSGFSYHACTDTEAQTLCANYTCDTNQCGSDPANHTPDLAAFGVYGYCNDKLGDLGDPLNFVLSWGEFLTGIGTAAMLEIILPTGSALMNIFTEALGIAVDYVLRTVFGVYYIFDTLRSIGGCMLSKGFECHAFCQKFGKLLIYNLEKAFNNLSVNINGVSYSIPYENLPDDTRFILTFRNGEEPLKTTLADLISTVAVLGVNKNIVHFGRGVVFKSLNNPRIFVLYGCKGIMGMMMESEFSAKGVIADLDLIPLEDLNAFIKEKYLNGEMSKQCLSYLAGSTIRWGSIREVSGDDDNAIQFNEPSSDLARAFFTNGKTFLMTLKIAGDVVDEFNLHDIEPGDVLQFFPSNAPQGDYYLFLVIDAKYVKDYLELVVVKISTIPVFNYSFNVVTKSGDEIIVNSSSQTVQIVVDTSSLTTSTNTTSDGTVDTPTITIQPILDITTEPVTW